MSKGIDTSVEDYLDEDPIISNQLFVCVSILTPNSIKTPDGTVVKQENQVRAFKIRGVYGSKEKAEKRCEEIRRFDKYHNVFVGDVGKWLPWDDNAENAEDAVYAEPKLNEMMKSYKESQQKAAEYTEERKMKAHADAMKKKKELEKTNQNDIITDSNIELNKELKNDKEKLEKLKDIVETEESQLKEEQEVILNKESKINKIDEELVKAKKLYEDLMEKYHKDKN